MTIRAHVGDLPDLSHYRVGAVAIDTETLGLAPRRDRLCVVQLSPGDGTADVVRIVPGQAPPKNILSLMVNPDVEKIFHYARFDIAVLFHTFGVMPAPIFCTKIASKLARTYTDRHGLKDVVREIVGVEVSKTQQSSDWGAEALTPAQLEYAASDVLHLHQIKAKLSVMLTREGRTEMAAACFAFLPTRAKLDLAGWDCDDIFAHS